MYAQNLAPQSGTLLAIAMHNNRTVCRTADACAVQYCTRPQKLPCGFMHSGQFGLMLKSSTSCFTPHLPTQVYCYTTHKDSTKIGQVATALPRQL